MEITREQKALATQVMLPMTPLPSTPGRCPAWIEAAGAECKLPAIEGLLCGRHHREAQKKLAALRKTTPHPWKQDPMTDHPLTEDRAAELWDTHAADTVPWDDWYSGSRRVLTSMLRAAFDAGREHERTPTEGDRPWEPLNGRPVRVGDEVRQDLHGLTRIAVVSRVDADGTAWTAEGGFIGSIDVGTWYVRPAPTRELPTTPRTVIVPADGREYIEAEVDGIVWRTREAILGLHRRWHGVWRAGRVAVGSTSSDSITLDTWKEDDR